MLTLSKLYKIEWRINDELVNIFNATNPRPIDVTEKWIEYLRENICKEGSLTPVIVK